MAKRDEQQRKLELLEQLSRQRAQITSQRSRLTAEIADKTEEIKDKINVPKRIKNTVQSSFSSSPTKWFVGSAIGGLLITKILFGRSSRRSSRRSSGKGSAKEAAVSGSVSRGLLTSAVLFFGKPFLKRALINKGKTMLLSRFMPQQQQIAEEQHYNQYQ